MEQRFGSESYVVRTEDKIPEIPALATNKAIGAKAVAKVLGIESNDILAFGDGNNDVALLIDFQSLETPVDQTLLWKDDRFRIVIVEMAIYKTLFEQFDAPYEHFDNTVLGDGFPEKLAVTSRLWVRSGYARGISAYLNFFLLKHFIETHDEAHPPRFGSFRSMARSFYRTDIFVREVTDSGRLPTGGISNEKVRQKLKSIMNRHESLQIPLWVMSYFGFQLLEAVEHQLRDVSIEYRRLHLSYMTKVYRIMGVPFSNDRVLMEQFCRDGDFG